MKHRNWALLSSIVCIFFLVTSACAAAPEFTLRAGTYMANAPAIQIEIDFMKKIEQRTNGRVKIDSYYAESAGKAEELLTLAGRGGLDIAASAPGYYPNQLLFWRAYQTPFVFNSPRQAINVLVKSYEELPIFKQEMDNMNLVWLFEQPMGEMWLIGKQPITSIQQLKGKKVRSFGGDIPRAHAAIGAVPVSASVQECYEALQKGVLDYNLFPLPTAVAQKITEVAKYYTGPVIFMSGHVVAMGKPAWNKLPKDIQEIILDQAKKTQIDYVNWLDSYDVEATKTIKGMGGIMAPLPPAELAKWKASTPDLLQLWAKDAENRGKGTEAQQVAKRWRELVAAGYGLKN
jgi:TRAP-type transport system periplasmic protein